MSVGLGRTEKAVMKVLVWERKNHGGALCKLLDYSDRSKHEPYRYQECDTTVAGLVDSILYGCNNDDLPAEDEPLSKAHRSLYQSVCRAVRSLERKGLVKTTKGVLFWEDGWWYKTVTMVGDRDKHLNLIEKGVGINT